MATIQLPDVLSLKAALQNARALPAVHFLREQQIAALEDRLHRYLDQLALEGVPETDLRLAELRSM